MNTDRAYAEKIASEYAPQETRKAVALKKLDRRAKRPALVFAYFFGSIMALAIGVGLCVSLGVLGDGSTLQTAIGVGIGVVGIFGVSVNYPIYRSILEKSKKKFSADILAIAAQIAEE